MTHLLASVLLGLVFGMAMASASSNKRVKMDEFFSDESLTADLTKVTWAHGVNSQAKLKAALEGPAMMLEADVLMGHEGDGSEFIPVMAHPPATKSDLSFQEFFDQVLHAVGNDSKKKGIKLDFKDIEAVTPVLKQLKNKKKLISFPVWINADVLRGPVSSTKKPLDAVEFLQLAKKYTPYATLSIGWTTRFGNDDIAKGSSDLPIAIGKYEVAHIDEILQLISTTDSISSTVGNSTEISFPVRAAIAVQSTDEILDLLGKAGPLASITLFSPSDDTVDHQKVRDFIYAIGKSRCYVDLPFSVYPDQTSSTTVLPGTFDRENSRRAGNSSDDHPGNNSGASLNIVSLALASTLVLMVL